ncbi:hypothetical protein [Arcticibacter tournemirensis]|uniref:Uncharacterized protein n=1 Tax=Arcticibacter tournemirensis TaxID=699437 RepID=A0A4Q0M8Q0_9SPHI|nr:hypothetical protein [Arcticibacter tournemirensis]RXF69484.1 hypothetical protein EKH83_12460 [Arcticibacter tournemirensis]
MLINSILCTVDQGNRSASDPLQKGFGVVSPHLATMLCLAPVLLREKSKKDGSKRKDAPKLTSFDYHPFPMRIRAPSMEKVSRDLNEGSGTCAKKIDL